jgi:tRNA modification GTPase
MPVCLIDTAGLRDSADGVERQGIERARGAAARADLVLWVADVRDGDADAAARRELPAGIDYLLVLNKTDLTDQPQIREALKRAEAALAEERDEGVARSAGTVAISALHGDGIPGLIDAVARFAGIDDGSAGTFSARRRHLEALTTARAHVADAAKLVNGSLDLAAEELRQAQLALAVVTGEVSSDDLLGEIFSRFCIGK